MGDALSIPAAVYREFSDALTRGKVRAPVERADGTRMERMQGTPQGSVVSPLLANLFLHYAFDLWMQRTFPHLFSRDTRTTVCHERTDRRRCDAVQEMREDPSEPAVRSRLQTTASCDGQEPWW